MLYITNNKIHSQSPRYAAIEGKIMILTYDLIILQEHFSVVFPLTLNLEKNSRYNWKSTQTIAGNDDITQTVSFATHVTKVGQILLHSET